MNKPGINGTQIDTLPTALQIVLIRRLRWLAGQLGLTANTINRVLYVKWVIEAKNGQFLTMLSRYIEGQLRSG